MVLSLCSTKEIGVSYRLMPMKLLILSLSKGLKSVTQYFVTPPVHFVFHIPKCQNIDNFVAYPSCYTDQNIPEESKEN